MDRTGKHLVPRGRARGLLLGAVAAGALALGGAVGATAAEPAPAGPVSGCIACHTDAERLKVEAAQVPVPAASSLQAGKG